MRCLLIWLLISVSTLLCHEIIPISTPKLQSAESGHWDEKTQSLYFVDWFSASSTATVCRYDYGTNKTFCAIIDGEKYPAFIIPVEGTDDQFVVGLTYAMKIIRWNGSSATAKTDRTVFEVETDVPSILNHGQTDATGRIYAGTSGSQMCGSPANSSLYSYSVKGGVKQLLNNTKITSGLTFNPKTKKLFFLDGCAFNIMKYDWNEKTGQLSNGRIVFEFKVKNVNSAQYLPIGISLDQEGFLWASLYKDSEIWKIDPRTSTVVTKIKTPTNLVLTPVFGGPKMNELFVTTGTTSVGFYTGKREAVKVNSLGGNLLKIVGLNVRGYPGVRIRL